MRKIYGYARVSTKEQHLDRQITALLDCGVEERDIVTDKASGASLERPGYQALKHTMLREGDTLVFKSLDRLSRNKEHISQELRYFKEHQVPKFLPTAFFLPLCDIDNLTKSGFTGIVYGKVHDYFPHGLQQALVA